MGEPTGDGVTLVLAVYNHAPFIAEALASYVEQDHPHLRLIVMDDASTDDSVAVIERELSSLGLEATTVFHTVNAGICATFNEALALVETPYVAFLAADDWMDPSRFSRQVDALRPDPSAALVYSDMWIVGDPRDSSHERYSSLWGDDWKGAAHQTLLSSLLGSNWIPAPSVMARTEHLRGVGGYDEALPFEDYDMWLRLAARGHTFAYLDHPLVFWRRTGTSLTETLVRRSVVDQNLTTMQILGKHLGRDQTIDRSLAPRLIHLAVSNYKMGSRSPLNSRILWRCLRARPSLQALGFAITMSLRQRRSA